jgi:hypothetical protein
MTTEPTFSREYVERNIRSLADIGGLYDLLALRVAADHRAILGFPLDTPANTVVESVIGRPLGTTNQRTETRTSHAEVGNQAHPNLDPAAPAD